MKKVFILFCLCSSLCLHAEGIWFNIMGDPADETVNTIEVDPTPVLISGKKRIMRVRVSRSADRFNWEGIPYRSYVSVVRFDCAEHSARYLVIDFFRLPAWKGESPIRSVYAESELRPMQFRDVEPNPDKRIIRAACQTASITTN
ncbi:MAG: surface-adhesin E family protein [Polaromonas sp.]